MLFKLKMCGQMVIKRRKIIKTDWVELSAGALADIQSNYMYLGILQFHESHNDKENSNIQVSPKDKTDPEEPVQ